MKVLLVLLALIVAAFAQRIYLGGNFLRVNPVVGRPYLACFNGTGFTRTHIAQQYTITVPLSSNTGYFFDATQAVLYYVNGTRSEPVFGVGSNAYWRTQVGEGADGLKNSFTKGSIDKMMINKAQTKLFVLGSFTKVGGKTIAGGPSQTTTNYKRLVTLEIGGSKTNPSVTENTWTNGVISVSSLIAAQGDSVLLVGSTSTTTLWYRVSGTTWTSVTHQDQNANTLATGMKQSSADERVFVKSSAGNPASTTSANQPTFWSLAAASSNWEKVFTQDDQTGKSTFTNALGNLWAAGENGAVYTTFSSAIAGTSYNADHCASVDKLKQYVYKLENNAATIQGTGARLAQDAKIDSPNPTSLGCQATFTGIEGLISDMYYDAVLGGLVVIPNADVKYLLVGDYQTPHFSSQPTAAGAMQGEYPEDKTKYKAKYINGVALLLKGTTYTVAYNGLQSLKASNIHQFQGKETCFASLDSYYNLWSPFVAMLENGKWQQVPKVSDLIEGDTVFGTVPTVNQIVTIDNDKNVIIAGLFRTINGEVFNSIAYYQDGSLKNLGKGLTVHSFDGDKQNDKNENQITRYAGMKPGSVKLVLYDSGAKILYVAGQFDMADSLYVKNFARYNFNTKTWSDVDGGVDAVTKMTLLGNDLYVIGCTKAGALLVRGIAKFNVGTQKWERVGNGFQTVNDIISYNGRILVTATAGELVTGSQIYAWNPSANYWTTILVKLEQTKLDTNTCVKENLVCSATTGAKFKVIHGKLYLINGGNVYVQSGDLFERLLTGITEKGTIGYAPDNQRVAITGQNTAYLFKEDSTSFLELVDRENSNGQLVDDTFYAYSSASSFTATLMVVLMIALALLF